jgi:hypothetical protein
MQVAIQSHTHDRSANTSSVPLKHVHVQFAHCCMIRKFPMLTLPGS